MKNGDAELIVKDLKFQPYLNGKEDFNGRGKKSHLISSLKDAIQPPIDGILLHVTNCNLDKTGGIFRGKMRNFMIMMRPFISK